jgi:hypothetical protein
MNEWMTGVAAVAVAIAAFLLLSGFLRAFRKWRGVRVITCPENHQPAAVKVAAFDAAKEFAVAGETSVHLKTCSRWPEMAGCDEACLNQITAAPEACLLQNIVGNWYDDKQCVFCGKEIEEIVWHERPPAVKFADGTIREWKELPAETLPAVFKTAEPVCWSCALFENFRKEHPEVIVARPRPVEPPHTLPPSTSTY